MEVPLSPIGFARRTRRLYRDRDGGSTASEPSSPTSATSSRWRAAPRDGWITYEDVISDSDGSFERPPIEERDLLTINYTSGTTAKSKGGGSSETAGSTRATPP
jgi:acyl-coenzyme A synthetase/AMP-(fatty) acid ligase